MARLWFSPAVSVEGDGPDPTIVVSTVEGAAEQLLTWAAQGPKWHSAVQVCADAMCGGATSNQARIAFIAAAEEAGRLREAVKTTARTGSVYDQLPI
ncbi:MAG TPA: DUF982 domain-containing protein [Ensifer sp.]|jgi:hypothetical protein|uniref:DUF982 domain-containing protein n=1 Tax=Ensifer sp. TaxID=1872086 RepID=UPI002E0E37AF|nr:DUF982 domain-containing protein [Ensifer sp.]